VWFEMLLLMHDAEPYGHLVNDDGEAMDPRELAKLINVDLRVVKRALAELEKRGVFSRDAQKIIYSRRLVKAASLSETRQINGRKGGNPALKKQTLSENLDNQTDIQPDKAPVKPRSLENRGLENREDSCAARVEPIPPHTREPAREAPSLDY